MTRNRTKVWDLNYVTVIMSETTKGLLLARSHMTICVSCGAIGFPRQSAPARVLPGLPCTDRRSRASAPHCLNAVTTGNRLSPISVRGVFVVKAGFAGRDGVEHNKRYQPLKTCRRIVYANPGIRRQ